MGQKRGKIDNCCVRPVLLYCSEIWVMVVTELKRLRSIKREKERKRGQVKATIFNLSTRFSKRISVVSYSIKSDKNSIIGTSFRRSNFVSHKNLISSAL